MPIIALYILLGIDLLIVLILSIRGSVHIVYENDLKVYEVAEAVGFRDLRYFTRQFYSFVGETPSSYRKKRHS